VTRQSGFAGAGQLRPRRSGRSGSRLSLYSHLPPFLTSLSAAEDRLSGAAEIRSVISVTLLGMASRHGRRARCDTDSLSRRGSSSVDTSDGEEEQLE